MRPTFYLRYVTVEHEANTPLCCSYSYGEPQYSQLQQWWEDENENGEWRFIEIDLIGSSEKPK
jgi:hypothetical protein